VYGRPREYDKATISPQTAADTVFNDFLETIAKRASEATATTTEITEIKIAVTPNDRDEIATSIHSPMKVYFIKRFLVIGHEISLLVVISSTPYFKLYE